MKRKPPKTKHLAIKSVNISYLQNPAYRDVLDCAMHLAPTYGSVTNALVQMVRKSPEYQTWKLNQA